MAEETQQVFINNLDSEADKNAQSENNINEGMPMNIDSDKGNGSQGMKSNVKVDDSVKSQGCVKEAEANKGGIKEANKDQGGISEAEPNQGGQNKIEANDQGGNREANAYQDGKDKKYTDKVEQVCNVEANADDPGGKKESDSSQRIQTECDENKKHNESDGSEGGQNEANAAPGGNKLAHAGQGNGKRDADVNSDSKIICDVNQDEGKESDVDKKGKSTGVAKKGSTKGTMSGIAGENEDDADNGIKPEVAAKQAGKNKNEADQGEDVVNVDESENNAHQKADMSKQKPDGVGETQKGTKIALESEISEEGDPNERFASAKEQIERMAKAYSEQSDEFQKLSSKHDRLVNENERLRLYTKSLDESLTTYKGTIKKLREECDRIKNENKETNEKLEKTVRQRNASEETVKRYLEDLEKRDKQISEAKQREKILKSNVHNLSSRNGNLDRDCSQKSQEIMNLTDKCLALETTLEDTHRHYQWELYQHQRQHEQLQWMYKDLQRENDDLKENNESLLLRLSKIAGSKLVSGNPDIADLSDIYRPTKLCEIFSEIYDNEWTEAFEELCEAGEKQTIKVLFSLLKATSEICEEITENQRTSLLSVSFMPTSTAVNRRQIQKNMSDMKPQTENGLETNKVESKSGDQDITADANMGEKDDEDKSTEEVPKFLTTSKDSVDAGDKSTFSNVDPGQNKNMNDMKPQTEKGLETIKVEPKSGDQDISADENLEKRKDDKDKNTGEVPKCLTTSKESIDAGDQAGDPEQNSAVCIRVVKEEDAETLVDIKDFRKKLSIHVLTAIKEELPKYIAESFSISLDDHAAVETYIKSCIRICWLAGLQDPPVYIRFDEVISEEQKFDKTNYREYTKSGPKMEYIVWPPIFLHKDGPLLGKGTAQGMK